MTQAQADAVPQEYQLLCWSANSSDQLRQTVSGFMEAEPLKHFSLTDIAFTLQQGRRCLPVRYAQVQGTSAPMALDPALLNPVTAGTPQVVWVFAGQGTQYSGMLAGLYQKLAGVREVVDQCCDVVERCSAINLKPLLLEASEAHDQQLQNTALAQPALFILAVAQVTVWQKLGVQPMTSFGHSLGEYCAAWQAGVWSLDVALELVYRRGQLMASAPAGAMLACRCDVATLETLPRSQRRLFDIAAVNGSRNTVISVAAADVSAMSDVLTEAEVDFSRVRTSHGFHSRMMDSLLPDFRQLVQASAPQEPQQSWVSNVTGQPITAELATDADYWCQHLRQPVQFYDCARTVLQLDPQVLLLEIGAGQNMSALLAEHGAPLCATALSRHNHQHDADWLQAVGFLWQRGVEIDWKGFAFQNQPGRVPLPGSALNPVRCWADLPEAPTSQRVDEGTDNPAAVTNAAASGERSVRSCLESVWCRVLGLSQVGDDDSFFSLGGNSIHLLEMTRLAGEQGLTFSVAHAYEYPLFGQLCECIERQVNEPVAETGGPAPFSLCRLDDNHCDRILQQVQFHNGLFDVSNQNASTHCSDQTGESPYEQF